MWPHYNPDLHVASWLSRSYCLHSWGCSNHQAATWHFWVHGSLCCVTASCI
jgi:hypothetical protein